MSRLTWNDGRGNWGVKGLDWRELVGTSPAVYAALCKLQDLETLIDRANTEDLRGGSDLLALEELLGMGSEERRNLSWILSALKE